MTDFNCFLLVSQYLVIILDAWDAEEDRISLALFDNLLQNITCRLDFGEDTLDPSFVLGENVHNIDNTGKNADSISVIIMICDEQISWNYVVA